jgi:hypothetical protein
LEADPLVSSYPYRFRVVSFENGVATISTPRSFDVPAYRFLAIIHPNLTNKADNDPQVIAAQQELIDHQKRAQGLILAQPQVESVEWELDTQWLAARGISVSPNLDTADSPASDPVCRVRTRPAGPLRPRGVRRSSLHLPLPPDGRIGREPLYS